MWILVSLLLIAVLVLVLWRATRPAPDIGPREVRHVMAVPVATLAPHSRTTIEVENLSRDVFRIDRLVIDRVSQGSGMCIIHSMRVDDSACLTAAVPAEVFSPLAIHAIGDIPPFANHLRLPFMLPGSVFELEVENVTDHEVTLAGALFGQRMPHEPLIRAMGNHSFLD